LRPRQRIATSRLHIGGVEDFHFDAELFQGGGALRKTLRKQHVRRLVDEVAGKFDALGDGLAPHIGRLGRGRVGDRDRKAQRLTAALLRVRFLGFVFVKPVAPEPRAERELRGRRFVPGFRRSFEQNRGRLRFAELAGHEPAEAGEIQRLAVLARRDADHQQPRSVDARGGQDVERGQRLALERHRLGGGGDRGGDRRDEAR
jgi:hypothetical protein